MITEDLEPLDIELGDPSVRRRIHHKIHHKNRITQRKITIVEVSLIGLIVLIIVLVVIITLAAVIQGRD